MQRAKKRLNKQPTFWWSEEIDWLRKRYFSARRAYQQMRSKYTKTDLAIFTCTAYKDARRDLSKNKERC